MNRRHLALVGATASGKSALALELARRGPGVDLISVGAYAAGSDALLDEALARFPQMEAFLQQNMRERAPYADSVRGLGAFAAKTPVAA